MDQSGEVFLVTSQVKRRYGDRSDMWIWRQLHKEGSSFPRPVTINGRRFWKLADLQEYERSLVAA
jgi:predicted DNA-binding transcriptional regulator AlpA